MHIPDNRNISTKLFRDLRNCGDERAEDEDFESRGRKEGGRIVPPRRQPVPCKRPRMEKRNHRTGNETSPRNERDDRAFTTGREPRVDEIVVSFRTSLGGQKWRLF